MNYNPEEAAKTLRWIRLLPQPVDASSMLVTAANKIPKHIESVDAEQYASYLSDGLALGYLMSALDPGMLAKLQAMKTWQKPFFPYMEQVLQTKRIEVFLQYAKAVGVDPALLFTPEDLRSRRNIGKVVSCITDLGILTQNKRGYNGPDDFWPYK